MGARIAQFIAVIMTAIALVPGGAHLLAMSAKMSMPEDPYFIAQQVYRGWAWLGAAIFIAIFANFASAVLAHKEPCACALSVIAGALLCATLAIFFTWTYPANEATGNWTTVPENWEALRAQWEYSHAANAVLSFAALFCAVGAMLPYAIVGNVPTNQTSKQTRTPGNDRGRHHRAGMVLN